jgi:hypothetical protein
MAAADIESLPFEDEKRMVTFEDGFAVDVAVVNYAQWIKKVRASHMPPHISLLTSCYGRMSCPSAKALSKMSVGVAGLSFLA